MKTGGGLYDYTPEQIDELRAQRGPAQARRGAQGARGGPREDLAPGHRLDRHRPRPAHVEHRRRHAGADPVLRRARRARRRALPVRHRLRPRAHEPRAPVRAPGADAEQTIPAQLALCGFAPADVGDARQSHLHFDHVGGNQHLPDAGPRARARDRPGAEPRAVRVLRLLGPTWDYDGRAARVPSPATRSSRRGSVLFETPGHTVGHYSLLVDARAGAKPMLFAFDVVYTREALEKGDPAGLPQRPGRGRPLDPPHQGARRGARRGDLLLARHGRLAHVPKHAPDYYELLDRDRRD